MAVSLQEKLKAKAGKASAAKEPPKAEPELLDLDDTEESDEPIAYDEGDIDEILQYIEGIECEAIVGGALQRIRFKARTNPALVKAMLLCCDPAAKVRDEWPSRGSFGKRDTKSARCVVITARITDSGKFVDLVCENGEDLKVSVSKKSSETFLADLQALGKVKEKNLAKLHKAFDEKGDATVILDEAERFGVNYWTTDDGKSFLDSLTPEPPAAKEGASDE